MPEPSSAQHPASRAPAKNAVSPWPYTTSNAVWPGRNSAGSNGAGSPTRMPKGVAFTTTSAAEMACVDVA